MKWQMVLKGHKEQEKQDKTIKSNGQWQGGVTILDRAVRESLWKIITWEETDKVKEQCHVYKVKKDSRKKLQM